MTEKEGRQGNIAPLLAAAAFFHPKASARVTLQEEIVRWLGSLGVSSWLGEVRKLISSERGTELEPFSVSRADLECASVMAAVTLHAQGGLPRFRIISRETEDDQGGLVLTRSMKKYYLERYALGERRMRVFTGNTFVPRRVPTTRQVARAGSASATIAFNEKGSTVTVPWPFPIVDASVLARRLQLNSYVSSNGKPLEAYGIRFQANHDHVQLVSGSAESQIKAMAMMAMRDVLIIREDPRDERSHQVMVELRAVEEETAALRMPALSIGSDYEWFVGRLPRVGDLSDEALEAIGSYFPPHLDYRDRALFQRQEGRES